MKYCSLVCVWNHEITGVGVEILAYCSSFSLVKFSKARRNEDLAKKICDEESTKTEGLDFYQGSIWDLLALLFLSHSAVSSSLWPHGLQHAGFPVLHYLLEFDQIHVHWVRDPIWPSHPLLSPSHPSLNLSQHQSLFQWVSSLHQVAKVLELQLQHQSFHLIFRVDFLENWLFWSLSPGLSRVLSSTSRKHPFFDAQPSLWSNSHNPTWLLEKPVVKTI